MAGIFDIIGPVMVGPSSSHTAGAVRIGLVSRKLLGEQPKKAIIYLHGSFLATGAGHGTHQALIAGLLGMEPDDMRIPQSETYACEQGMEYEFNGTTLRDAHANTALLFLAGASGRELEIQAASIGGGRIVVNKIDGIDVNFSGENNTLVVHNQDRPGQVARVTGMVTEQDVNISTMQLYRKSRGGNSVMVLELDQDLPLEAVKKLEKMDGVYKVTYLSAS